jgi:hypothetical protein
MDNFVHIDEKWFVMTRTNNSYILLPEEPDPLRTVQNKNNIGKVMFLTVVAKPRSRGGGVAPFDGKIGTWTFVTETPALKKKKQRKGDTGIEIADSYKRCDERIHVTETDPCYHR